VCVIKVGAVCSAFEYWNADTLSWGNSPKDPGQKDLMYKLVSPETKSRYPDEWRVWGPIDKMAEIANGINSCARKPSKMVTPFLTGVMAGAASGSEGGIWGSTIGGTAGGFWGVAVGCSGNAADKAFGF
jgi:hypothetical protein